ncbi:MAG: peptidylprolyl isomerase, partial [Patulibacter minatonensis]
IELDQKDNPKTANAFASLVRANYYDGTAFHRVVKGWVVQGWRSGRQRLGRPDLAGGRGPAEGREVHAWHRRDGEDRDPTPSGASGSQFFIVVGEDAGLPTDYAIAREGQDRAATPSTRSATSAPMARTVRRRAPWSSRRPYLDVK